MMGEYFRNLVFIICLSFMLGISNVYLRRRKAWDEDKRVVYELENPVYGLNQEYLKTSGRIFLNINLILEVTEHSQ